MKIRKKIKLGLISYGSLRQEAVNLQQFNFLKKELIDFELFIYNLRNKRTKKLVLENYKKNKLDIVLKNSYGRGNEYDVESFLEINKIPYLGSNSMVVLLATSKYNLKKKYNLNNLPTLPYIYIRGILRDRLKKKLDLVNDTIGYPCLIKDTTGTDSSGLFLANNYGDLLNQLTAFFKKNKFGSVIIEKYLDNSYEVTCLVSDNKTYTPVGIVKKDKILSFESKKKMYLQCDVPAKVGYSVLKKIKFISLKAHNLLGCRDFSRSDFLIKDGKIFLLETDVHPGFRKNSPTVLSINYSGQNLNDFFKKLCLKKIKV